jgi:cytochrome c oxidase cbb3-type subunit III
MRSRCLEAAVAAAVIASLSGCSREARRFEEPAGAATLPNTIQQSDLQPGTRTPAADGEGGPYDYNAFAISEGKRLYEWFNCTGCHAQGGGGIGPPLMDDKWIYGAAPENIRATLLQGRPNGMPAFRGRITEQQLWQIVAYVRSMSGQVPKDAATSRSDHMFMKPSEQSSPDVQPTPSNLPSSSTR